MLKGLYRSSWKPLHYKISQAALNDKIEFIWDTVVAKIEGYVSRKDGLRMSRPAKRGKTISGLFVFVGIKPNTHFSGVFWTNKALSQ
jgi:thioredoxin reductase